VPGRIPREPRLNPISGLPKHIIVKISPTNRGGGKLHPSILLSIERHIEPTIKATTQNITAHKIINMARFITCG
jgi:hypothetical protein